ncbi:excalibur domain protein [Aeromicrobium marinum DSM 15272]|uniref:Excalibur domain protein n=1 Tax=Aeromicrobium marinum DSM 15272 TaxID=585531 RepID=E2SBU5_9ACTN|nr:excalibur domain protein [Aeromicrobium marinum DSM 15272]
MCLMGLVDSGLEGLLGFSGLYVLGVAVVALIRGHVEWAGMRSRALGGVALATAFALIAFSGASADPQPESSSAAVASEESVDKEDEEPEPAPTPEPTSEPTTPAVSPASAEQGTALSAVAALAVKGRAPKTGYSREAFGQAWFDADRNGCDTRNDMLRRDLVEKNMSNSCKVLAGTLRPDPYTGQEIRFEVGGPSEVDIDHVVALSDAWQKGAGTWSAERRLAFANDPLNLLAVDAGANRSKGDGDAATWLPPNRPYRCEYIARQVAVKVKYEVWVTAAERDAMVRVLSNCADLAATDPGTAPTEAALPRSSAPTTPPPAPAPAPAPAPFAPQPPPPPAPAPPPPAPSSVYYENCTAVRAAGAAPIYAGQPGYSNKLDRDGDGVACE